jgi:hypothetical protein
MKGMQIHTTAMVWIASLGAHWMIPCVPKSVRVFIFSFLLLFDPEGEDDDEDDDDEEEEDRKDPDST